MAGAVPCRGRGDGATLIVDQYMHELYWSAAEDLPETVRLDDVDQCIERNDLSDAQKEKLTSHQRAFIDGGAIPQWSPNECAADLLAKASNHGEKVLPPRHIQHCHLRDLWWAFLAWFLALPAVASDSDATFQPMRCPSWSTFWRVWTGSWRHLIKFRKIAQHAQCEICFNCSSFLHKSSASAEEKKAAAAEWREHLRGTYTDRLIYYHLRWSSRVREHLILVVIVDSMDKSKFVWPAYAFRPPHNLDKLVRPKLVLTAAICHGFHCSLFVSHDETTPHGASNYCEVLSRCFDRVFEICKSRRWKWPNQLVVQTDNTTAQAKNSEGMMFLSLLARRNLFGSVTNNYLCKGHTHEDVDAVFGLVLSKVIKPYKFSTPAELVTQLQLNLIPHFAAKGESCSCELLNYVHNFKEWMDPVRVHLDSAFKRRHGIDVPHSFIIKKRRDLSSHERLELSMPQGATEEVCANESAPHAHDTFIITKRFMHSTVSAPPLLVLTYRRCQRILTGGPTKQLMKDSFTQEKKNEIIKLASALEDATKEWDPGFSLYRVATELRKLANGDDFPQRAPLNFLCYGRPDEPPEVPETRNNFFNNHPEMVWRLMSRFGDE